MIITRIYRSRLNKETMLTSSAWLHEWHEFVIHRSIIIDDMDHEIWNGSLQRCFDVENVLCEMTWIIIWWISWTVIGRNFKYHCRNQLFSKNHPSYNNFMIESQFIEFIWYHHGEKVCYHRWYWTSVYYQDQRISWQIWKICFLDGQISNSWSNNWYRKNGKGDVPL